jgi:PAS domain S-box-containing protein
MSRGQMSSTADEGRRPLSNVGLPRTDWESMFWAVFAASENPMAIVDANRLVVSANSAMQRLLSRTEEEIVGRSMDETLPPADRSTIADRWRAILARGEGHGLEKLVIDRDLDTTVSYAAHVAHIGGRFGHPRCAHGRPGTGRRRRRVRRAARTVDAARARDHHAHRSRRHQSRDRRRPFRDD